MKLHSVDSIVEIPVTIKYRIQDEQAQVEEIKPVGKMDGRFANDLQKFVHTAYSIGYKDGLRAIDAAQELIDLVLQIKSYIESDYLIRSGAQSFFTDCTRIAEDDLSERERIEKEQYEGALV